MDKKFKTGVLAIAGVSIASCIGALAYYKYALAKKASYEEVYAELIEIADEIIKEDEIAIEYGSSTIDLEDEVSKAKTSHPDVEITYTVNGESDIATLGTYEAHDYNLIYSFCVKDKYNQEISYEKPVTYKVEDTQAPVITLKETEVTVYQGSEYDVSDIVESVLDLVDGDLEKIQANTQASEDYAETSLKSHGNGYYFIETEYNSDSPVGEYEVKVVATDRNGLVSKASAIIEVIEKPVTSVVATTNTVERSYYDPSRIYIGSYTAVLYNAPENQAITDAADSAIYYQQHGRTVVADHAYQGFTAMLYNDTGVMFGSKIHKASTHYGTINETETDIYYDDGGSFLGNDDASIVMFTCIDGQGRRVVTYWDYD